LEVDPLRELQVPDDVKVQKLGPGAFAIEVVQVVRLHTLLHGLKQGQVGLAEGLSEVNFCLGGGIPQDQMEQGKGREQSKHHELNENVVFQTGFIELMLSLAGGAN
jgi:hypothetical protein